MTEASLYQQLIDLPETFVGEILDGKLVTQHRLTGPQGVALSGLNIHLARKEGWRNLPQPELHFVRDTVVAVPDFAGWRYERMPQYPDDHRLEIVPDWVCEILCPATVKKDRIQKLPLYARYGVAYAWLIDPIEKTLEAFKLENGHWLLLATLADDEPVSIEPFDAITFSLADLWV